MALSKSYKRTAVSAACFAVLLSSSASAQESPSWQVKGLPWSASDVNQKHLMSAQKMAEGLLGAKFVAPPELSPPLEGEATDQAIDDVRNQAAPFPAKGWRAWTYWQARHLMDSDAPERAALLFEMLAPTMPGAARHLHLDAARAWAMAGQPTTARKHLERAGQGEPVPSLEGWKNVAARVELASSRTLEALALVLNDSVTGPRLPSDETCAIIAEATEALAEKPLDPPALRALEPLVTALGISAGACANTPDKERVVAAIVALREQLSGVVFADQLSPTSKRALLAQARVSYRNVRNTAAQETLESLLARKGLSSETLCEANFMLAITFKRLKKKSKSGPFYAAAARACSREVGQHAPELHEIRIRALYWGAMTAIKESNGRLARERLHAILEEAPEGRHADDALYHLAKISDKAAADTYRTQLKQRYPDGDMLISSRWQPIRTLLYAEKWGKAVTLLENAVTHLPDSTSHTQGRFLYYLGYAHDRLPKAHNSQAAIQAWKRCFQENLTAFYGQLCAQELMRKRGGSAWLLEQSRPKTSDDIFFSVTDPAVRDFIALGDFARASRRVVRIATPLTYGQATGRAVHDLWLAAYLGHLSGEYATSHQIPRRKIPGFPQRYGLPTAQTRLLWEVAYPDPYQKLVDHWAKERNVDGFFARGIMREESGFAPSVVSWAGAVGLMQIMIRVGKSFGRSMDMEIDEAALQRPDINLPIATKILKTLARKFDRHPILMAAGYNAGPGAAGKWRKRDPKKPIGFFAEDVPYRGTRSYCRHVTGSYGTYQWLWGDAPLVSWGLTVPEP